VAALRARTELASVHVLDHPKAQQLMVSVLIGNSCLRG
jgi:hypothetical protein